jgi:hypothetical protein
MAEEILSAIWQPERAASLYITRYMDLHCCNEGGIVVFDRRSTVAWEDKLYMRKETVKGKTVTIMGM